MGIIGLHTTLADASVRNRRSLDTWTFLLVVMPSMFLMRGGQGNNRKESAIVPEDDSQTCYLLHVGHVAIDVSSSSWIKHRMQKF
jgi:hypothetical protein